jgi:predicted transcriptional regulator
MHHEDMPGGHCLPPNEQDRKTEAAVLDLLLDEHPIRLTADELALVLNAFIDQGHPGDAAERAVRELVGAGLVHRDGRFLAPSRAALYFSRLESD